MFRPSTSPCVGASYQLIGLTRPFRFTSPLSSFSVSLVAGLVYASVVFHALNERTCGPHVQPHSAH